MEAHWTVYLGPTAQVCTALIAAFVAVKFGLLQASIARQQAETARQQAATAAAAARTARNRLKFDLFDRRAAMYDLVYAYIDTVVSDLKVVSEKDGKFLSAVRPVGWLTDATVTTFILKTLRDKMVELSQIAAELEYEQASGEKKMNLLLKQTVVQAELYSMHEGLAKVFEPFLKLEH